MQHMPHTFFLRFHVEFVVWIWFHLDRNVLYYLKSVSLQTYAFYRIIAHQAHFRYADMT